MTETSDMVLEPQEVADRLGVPLSWVMGKYLDLPGIVRWSPDGELVGVRVGALEHWQRAAQAAFPYRETAA